MLEENEVPFFSVIIPVYNKEPHIFRSINSVLEQSFRDFELIIICDPSTDNSNAEVDNFTDPRIHVFHRENPGPGGYAARNLGIKKSKGEWVAFLDADDEWLFDHLNNLFDLISHYSYVSMACTSWFVSEMGVRYINPFSRGKRGCRSISTKEYLSVHASGHDIVHTNAVAIKRDALVKIGGFPHYSDRCKRAGDGQTWLRVALLGTDIAWSATPGAIYYQDSVNMVTKQKKYQVDENGLITYMNEVLHYNKYPDHFKLIKKYRDKRIVSAIFQDLEKGEVSRKHLNYLKKFFSWDLRWLCIVLAYLSPSLGKKIFALKKKMI